RPHVRARRALPRALRRGRPGRRRSLPGAHRRRRAVFRDRARATRRRLDRVRRGLRAPVGPVRPRCRLPRARDRIEPADPCRPAAAVRTERWDGAAVNAAPLRALLPLLGSLVLGLLLGFGGLAFLPDTVRVALALAVLVLLPGL